MGSTLRPVHSPPDLSLSLVHRPTRRREPDDPVSLTIRHTRPVTGHGAALPARVLADRALAALAAGQERLYREEALRMGVALDAAEVALAVVPHPGHRPGPAHVAATVRLTGRGSRLDLVRLDNAVQRQWPLSALIGTVCPARPGR